MCSKVPIHVQRWLKFNVVGAGGMVVHFGLLTLLVHVVGMHYLWATAIAVEAAIFQNFVWHRRWTWADRPAPGWIGAGMALLRFNLTNGLVSLIGYMMSACLFTGSWGLDPVLANALGLLPCGLVNFFLADGWVFPTSV